MLMNYLVPQTRFVSRGAPLRTRATRPFGEFHREIEDLFDRAYRGASVPTANGAEKPAEFLNPRVNVVESDDGYSVAAELPGLDEKELKVELNDGLLTIEGEKKVEQDSETGNYHLVERTFGTFKRTFTVPTDVDVDGIDATFKNGVLTVTLPKKEEAKKAAKTIAVKAN
ncbi:MAG: Hsp20/alpha crystallin family protein [Proteobacteria bacterium]|nr:Hsp20/alpha crystallin family protein [Pseudomonadota bacterium]